MIASAQTLRILRPVSPFFERGKAFGYTYGLGPAGYDIRLSGGIVLQPGGFAKGAALEHFDMPDNLLGVVHDKSTWARQGICLQNTVIEPGWRGYLTLEITNHSEIYIQLLAGVPIAQVVFHLLDLPTDRPYNGKYQDQEQGPQEAKLEF